MLSLATDTLRAEPNLLTLKADEFEKVRPPCLRCAAPPLLARVDSSSTCPLLQVTLYGDVHGDIAMVLFAIRRWLDADQAASEAVDAYQAAPGR
jgi:hypothetical protein